MFKIRKKPVNHPCQPYYLSVNVEDDDTIQRVVDRLYTEYQESVYVKQRYIWPTNVNSHVTFDFEYDYDYRVVRARIFLDPTQELVDKHNAEYENLLAQYNAWYTENETAIKEELIRRENVKKAKIEKESTKLENEIALLQKKLKDVKNGKV